MGCIDCSPFLRKSGRMRIAANPILSIGHTTPPPLLAGMLTYPARGLDPDIEHTAAHGTNYDTTIGIFIAWPCNPGAPTMGQGSQPA